MNEIIWRLGIGLIGTIVIWVAIIYASFYSYRTSKGRMYRILKEQPRRYLFISMILAFLFALFSIIPDLFDVLFASIKVEPVNINRSLMFAGVQFLLIIILGIPFIWLSFKFATTLAHKFLHHRFNEVEVE